MATRKTPQDRLPKAAAVDGDAMAPVTVNICDRPVTVPAPGGWRQSANDALAEGRHNEWAVRVLSRDDAITWYELDPTNQEVGEFFEAMFDAFAEQAGPTRRAQIDAFRLRRRQGR